VTVTAMNESLSVTTCVLLVLLVIFPNVVRFILAIQPRESEYKTETARAVDAAFSLVAALVGILTVGLLIHFNISVFTG